MTIMGQKSNQPNRRKKSTLTPSEMAEMVRLSPTRFDELVASGHFPSPKYDGKDNPVYIWPDQQVCLWVRQNGLGINDAAIDFTAPPNSPGDAACWDANLPKVSRHYVDEHIAIEQQIAEHLKILNDPDAES